MSEFKLNDIEEVPAKGHFETVQEYYKEAPIYDDNGVQIGTEKVVIGRDVQWVWDDPEEIKKQQDAESSLALKTELAKIKEDIEQEVFGIVRDDFVQKKARAAEIINELRVLEGKEPRTIKA